MSEGKEEIYSTMFSSLKHPARRKILRILADKPLTFSEMVDLLGVSSSNLTYHLESLGEIVTKNDDGVYRLSTFGLAAVERALNVIAIDDNRIIAMIIAVVLFFILFSIFCIFLFS